LLGNAAHIVVAGRLGLATELFNEMAVIVDLGLDEGLVEFRPALVLELREGFVANVCLWRLGFCRGVRLRRSRGRACMDARMRRPIGTVGMCLVCARARRMFGRVWFDQLVDAVREPLVVLPRQAGETFDRRRLRFFLRIAAELDFGPILLCDSAEEFFILLAERLPARRKRAAPPRVRRSRRWPTAEPARARGLPCSCSTLSAWKESTTIRTPRSRLTPRARPPAARRRRNAQKSGP